MHTATKRQTAPRTVLVVDDSVAIRSQVRQLFLSDGFAMCAEAENGREAIEVARGCKPDVIILDVAMPVMGGIEAAPKLRELHPDIPIILFTLHADYLRTIDLASLGISTAVSKNHPLDQLLLKAHELMENQDSGAPG